MRWRRLSHWNLQTPRDYENLYKRHCYSADLAKVIVSDSFGPPRTLTRKTTTTRWRKSYPIYPPPPPMTSCAVVAISGQVEWWHCWQWLWPLWRRQTTMMTKTMNWRRKRSFAATNVWPDPNVPDGPWNDSGPRGTSMDCRRHWPHLHPDFRKAVVDLVEDSYQNYCCVFHHPPGDGGAFADDDDCCCCCCC